MKKIKIFVLKLLARVAIKASDEERAELSSAIKQINTVTKSKATLIKSINIISFLYGDGVDVVSNSTSMDRLNLLFDSMWATLVVQQKSIVTAMVELDEDRVV